MAAIMLFQFSVRKANFDPRIFSRLTAIPVFLADGKVGQFLPFDRNPRKRVDGVGALSQQSVSFRAIHAIRANLD